MFKHLLGPVTPPGKTFHRSMERWNVSPPCESARFFKQVEGPQKTFYRSMERWNVDPPRIVAGLLRQTSLCSIHRMRRPISTQKSTNIALEVPRNHHEAPTFQQIANDAAHTMAWNSQISRTW